MTCFLGREEKGKGGKRRGEERRERRGESRGEKRKDHSALLLGVKALIRHTQPHASVLKAERNEHKCYKHQQSKPGIILSPENRTESQSWGSTLSLI